MTIKEAAQVVGKDAMTVRRWIRSGKLKASKSMIGGVETWHINESDLDGFKTTQNDAKNGSTFTSTDDRQGLDSTAMADVLTMLRDQLDAKDDQLKAKDEQINKLQLLLANQQQQQQSLQTALQKALPTDRPRRRWFWQRGEE